MRLLNLKTERDGSNKKKLCSDGSRCVNLSIKEQKVTLQRALPAIIVIGTRTRLPNNL
jgi:hypothetical protein